MSIMPAWTDSRIYFCLASLSRSAVSDCFLSVMSRAKPDASDFAIHIKQGCFIRLKPSVNAMVADDFFNGFLLPAPHNGIVVSAIAFSEVFGPYVKVCFTDKVLWR